MTMKAAVRYSYGSPEDITVEERSAPIPKSNEVLVRVYATTVNRTDAAVLAGKPFVFRFFTGLRKPRHAILGTDFAGVIKAVGREVKNYKVGDRVFGFDDNAMGSQAQLITVDQDSAIERIPEQTTFVEAVASAEGAHYALNFINKVKLNAGDEVMVNGGSGAIGSAAIQLLKNQGYIVWATAPTAYLKRVQELGVDHIIDFEKEDFTECGHSFKFVFDAVGKSSFGRCRKIIQKKGVYISSELGRGGQNIFFAMMGPLSSGKRVIFPFPKDIKTSLSTMRKLLKAGKFKPLLDRHYKLSEVQEAYRYVGSGKKIGNVILDLTD